jgi:hypothetical protein
MSGIVLAQSDFSNSMKNLDTNGHTLPHSWVTSTILLILRNENLAKNRFYCALRKYLRLVNRFLKVKAKRSKNQK